jgi:diadenosine tetraphosphate (Ap4A) HIT family hydrolase
VTDVCDYCRPPDDGPLAVLTTPEWSVVHGPPEATRAGGLKIVSRRHLTDFCELDDAEAASFGPLLRTLDAAVREVTGAERVHLVSTRDRVQHFHAWLYPRYVEDETRGTTFLAAPQSGSPAAVAEAAERLRAVLQAW